MKQLLSVLMLLIIGKGAFAQDLEFTQFYASPIYLNPAFAGSHGCPRFTAIHRDQWTNISGSYISTAASYDQYFKNISGGIGILASNDIQAKTINTSTINFIYSYHVNLNRKWTLMFGAKATWCQKFLDWDKLTFGDQIDPFRGFIFSTGDKKRGGSRGFFDVSSGIVLFNKIFNIGFAANHLATPNQSMILGENSKLPMRFTAHASANIPVGAQSKYSNSTTIMPSIIWSYHDGFYQMNVGTYIKFSNFTMGAWYRSKDAFILTFGINTGKFKLGYSYDVTASRLNNGVSGGAHEISLGLNLHCKSKPQKFRTIACPSF
ncbi:MAG: type IX secretion system membrane protein PorP/SprF [Flavobacteriia bacterium]|nr:type IX secretion system membrane protein PorP/SprF [Flavobacteriia bacterium]